MVMHKVRVLDMEGIAFLPAVQTTTRILITATFDTENGVAVTTLKEEG